MDTCESPSIALSIHFRIPTKAYMYMYVPHISSILIIATVALSVSLFSCGYMIIL